LIARAAAVWRPLAPSQDAIVFEGLAYLKQLLHKYQGGHDEF
jgi:hypothetical protein